MFRLAISGLLLAAALVVPVAADQKKTSSKLTQEAKDGAQITQENIVKLKLKKPQPVQPNSPPPSLGGPPPSPPLSLPNP